VSLSEISKQELARRLIMLSAAPLTVGDVMRLAAAADVRIGSADSVDAAQAQRLLDQISPPVAATGAQIVAADWPPPERPKPAPPVVFSSPGAVDGPEDQPVRPRNSYAPRAGRPTFGRTGRRGAGG
jgi:hypothetical protein